MELESEDKNRNNSNNSGTLEDTRACQFQEDSYNSSAQSERRVPEDGFPSNEEWAT